MLLKNIYKTAGKYARYYHDVFATIPSEDVKNILKEKGWRFTEAPEASAIFNASMGPYFCSNALLSGTVTTENGTNVYKAGSDIIRWYEDDKKAAARIKHGIGTP